MIKTKVLGQLLAFSVVAVMTTSSMAATSVSSDYLQKKRDSANQGNVIDQRDLGRMYFLGKGFSRGDYESAKWFRKAANQNNAEAQYALGSMHYYGTGVKLDHDEAFHWTKLASDNGYADAKYNLGTMYFNGHGVERNEDMARNLYKEACDEGSTFSCDTQISFID